MKNVKFAIYDKSYNVVDSLVKRRFWCTIVLKVRAMEVTIPSPIRPVEWEILKHIRSFENCQQKYPPMVSFEQLDGAYEKM
jgi:hypothetical protein